MIRAKVAGPLLAGWYAETPMVPFKPGSNRVSCWLLAGLTALVATMNCSCAERYCQSGSNGTQCPTINEIEWQRTQQREEPWPAEQTTEPAPGCVLSTPTGFVQRPYPANASGAPASLPPVYLASGACVSRQQPVYGAVR
jgi:hypothetical protein